MAARLVAARHLDDRPRAMRDIILKPGRDRSLRRGHPWLMSGAVARMTGDAEASPGEWVCVRSADGEVIGHGHLSPASTIRVRLLSFGEDDPGEELLEARIAASVGQREAHPLLSDTDAIRLVNAEADGLPGLVVDRFADVLVVKLLSVGMSVRESAVAQALKSVTEAPHALLRADGRSARREAFAAKQGVLWGTPPEQVEIVERGRHYAVDVHHGQKTGFYLDQRDARDLVQHLAEGRRTLDVFSYTGGFAVAAGVGGAKSLDLIESSADALKRAGENLARNELTMPAGLRRGDAFALLREGVAAGETWDLLILDPPPLARRKADVKKASRAYKDLLLQGFACAAPGAYVLAFTCSHHVSPELFSQIVFAAALDAGRDVQVQGRLAAPADHPVSVRQPEGHYLSGLLLRVAGDAGRESSA
ncbi:MAG: class I SAM-dependent rRNA methyltransferase [Deltaproteobacteria bacterium]|nr:class I SAM-dependent rRNA methyltransferase [Deltaproteobacteria bacterium]